MNQFELRRVEQQLREALQELSAAASILTSVDCLYGHAAPAPARG